MAPWPPCGRLESVASYAVLWQHGEGQPLAGRLQFTPRSLTLHGGERGCEARVEILYDDIDCATRAHERIGPLRAIEVTSREHGPVRIAALTGGVHREIYETVRRLAAAAA